MDEWKMVSDTYQPMGSSFAESASLAVSDKPLSLCRLTITLRNGALWHHKPLYSEIIQRARGYGLSGAGVFVGAAGFGSDGVIHTTRILSLSDHLPIMIVVIDEESKIRGFVQRLEASMEIESATIEHVQALRVRRSNGVPR